MTPDHARRNRISGNDFPAGPKLRKGDELWLRRGQRLGELLLTSKASAYGWAAALGLMGAALIMLGLAGGHGGLESASFSVGEDFAP